MIKKRSVRIAGHETSITLEDDFWRALSDIAEEKHLPLNALITHIDAERNAPNLSSAIRLYVLAHLQVKLSERID